VTTNTGLVYRATGEPDYVSAFDGMLTAATHGGMARPSWSVRLVTYRDGLQACRRSPIQVL